MSCERRVETFKEVQEVRIECCNSVELQNLENSIVSAIEQKLEKLNILIKNCDVYAYSGSLLINDRFNICSDLIKVASAFGLNIKQIECSLRGKNYVISDSLISVLLTLESKFVFGSNVQNKEVNSDVIDILHKHGFTHVSNKDVLEMVRNIKKNGEYVTTKTREVTEEYEDGRLIGRSESNWDSDATSIRNELLKMSKNAQDTIKQANSQLRDGTAQLIYSRARQMGYAVQEVKKGTQTQLVLVRCE